MMIEIQTIEGGWKRCLLTRGENITKEVFMKYNISKCTMSNQYGSDQ